MDLPNKQPGASPPPPQKKDLKPLIPVGATPASRPATKRFADFLFAESPRVLTAKIGRELVVPRIKAGVEEALRSFISGMFWGSGQQPFGTMVQGTVLRGGVNTYTNMQQSPMTQAAMLNATRPPGVYQDIDFPSQQHAEIVLAAIIDLLNQYRVVAVADLYELANMKPAAQDHAYGWTNLDSARISKNREGFRLELPRPSLI